MSDESKTLTLSEVHVADRKRGQGIGAQAFAMQLAAARRLGVDRLILFAARADPPLEPMVGHKVWPKYAFDTKLSLSSPLLAELPDQFKHITFLSDLPSSEKGREWWAEKGFGLTLKFDMKPGSRSWKIWDEYRKRKGI